MATLAIVGHSDALLSALYAAVEEEYPAMDTPDDSLEEDPTENDRAFFYEELVQMLLGQTPIPDEFKELINQLHQTMDNDMIVDRLQRDRAKSISLNYNGYFLIEFGSSDAA